MMLGMNCRKNGVPGWFGLEWKRSVYSFANQWVHTMNYQAYILRKNSRRFLNLQLDHCYELSKPSVRVKKECINQNETEVFVPLVTTIYVVRSTPHVFLQDTSCIPHYRCEANMYDSLHLTKFILESSLAFCHYSSQFLVAFQMTCSECHFHSFYSY